MSMPPVLKPIFNESPAPTPTKTPPIIAFIKGFVVTVTIGTNIVTTEMPITLMKLRIVDCFPNFTNPRMKTGMFKNKMKIPVLIWIPKFVYNNVAMICAIPFIPAEKTFAGIKKKFKPTAEVKAVIAITAIFFIDSFLW